MKVVCGNCETVFTDEGNEGKGTIEDPWVCPRCGHKLRMVTTKEALEALSASSNWEERK